MTGRRIAPLLALALTSCPDDPRPLTWSDLPPLYYRHRIALPVVAAPGVMPRFIEAPP